MRAHVLLCMLAYHVEHHMRARLAPMLYDETDHDEAAALRATIVARAQRSEAARSKQTTGRTHDGLPVHSFQSLLADLATYLLADGSAYINGEVVAIDGGEWLKGAGQFSFLMEIWTMPTGRRCARRGASRSSRSSRCDVSF